MDHPPHLTYVRLKTKPMKYKSALATLLSVAAFLTLTVAPLRAQPRPINTLYPAGTAHLMLADVTGESASDSAAAFSSVLGMLVPIVAIVMGCSIPIIIVVAVCYFKHRKAKMLHETVRAMVEKGVPVPPEMFGRTGNGQPGGPSGSNPFQDVYGTPPPRNDLRTGLIMTGLGVGLVIFIGKLGAIVLFLGVAFILVGLVTKNKKQPEQPPKL